MNTYTVQIDTFVAVYIVAINIYINRIHISSIVESGNVSVGY